MLYSHLRYLPYTCINNEISKMSIYSQTDYIQDIYDIQIKLLYFLSSKSLNKNLQNINV
jgi:hypothetical protein